MAMERRGHKIVGRRHRRYAWIVTPMASQYQQDLNHQADLLFWNETGYKVNQRLDPRVPADRRMIPRWWDARERIARSMSPQMLRQSVAADIVFTEHAHSNLPYYVYSSGGPVGEAVIPFSEVDRAYSYARARLGDSDYVALFSAADPKWPNPVFEAFQRPTV